MIYETFVPSLGKNVRNGERPPQLVGRCIVKKIILVENNPILNLPPTNGFAGITVPANPFSLCGATEDVISLSMVLDDEGQI
jgi:hypothetical protein